MASVRLQGAVLGFSDALNLSASCCSLVYCWFVFQCCVVLPRDCSPAFASISLVSWVVLGPARVPKQSWVVHQVILDQVVCVFGGDLVVAGLDC